MLGLCKRIGFTITLAAAFCSMFRSVDAAGTYRVEQSLSLEVLDSNPAISVVEIITGPVTLFPPFVDGNGGAFNSGTSNALSSGRGLVNITRADGFVVGGPQPSAISAAFVEAFGAITLINADVSNVTIDLALTVEHLVELSPFDSATVTSALWEFGIFLDTFQSAQIALGGRFYPYFKGPGALLDSDLTTSIVSVDLTPGTHTILVSMFTAGLAFSIPEPSAVISALIGLVPLVGLGLRSRTKARD